MFNIIFGIIGLIVGRMFHSLSGAIAGFCFGFLFGEIVSLKSRIRRLEEIQHDNTLEHKDTPHDEYEIDEEFQVDAEDIEEEITWPLPDKEIATPQPVMAEVKEKPQVSASTKAAPTTQTTKIKDKENILDGLVKYGVQFFSTGNVFAKVGAIVLFFGVAFLLKYVAQRNFFPIEARLASVAVGAVALLGFGWRIRMSRPAYGLILQGAGFGILYLNLFAAAKFYELIPITLALGIMVGLVALCSFLALLQDSKVLVGFGAFGGFIAPVLMSTLSGNHIVIFSYYTVLNAGILGISWFKAWREINLIGFVFTFIIAMFWGGNYYQPLYFSSVEPFLILFFLFYLAISVLFALRQPVNLKGYVVDGTLVFGTPLSAFFLQYGLVHDFTYGMAISAFAMGCIYISLTVALWKKRDEGMEMLTEAFLALGVIFGSLAIPLALNDRWTSISWLLEGAGLVWVGVRQERLLARNFGLLLIAGATVSYFLAFEEQAGAMFVFNSIYLGAVMISIVSLFVSFLLYKYSYELMEWEEPFQLVMLVLGLTSWYSAGLYEMERVLVPGYLYNCMLVFVSLSCLGMSLAARRLEWSAMRMVSIGLLPVMALILIGSVVQIPWYWYHPFFRFGSIAWIIAFGVQYMLLLLHEDEWPEGVVSWWHAGTLWLLTFILAMEASWWAGFIIKGAVTWKVIPFGLIPAAITGLLFWKGKALSWPVNRFESEYLGTGAAGLILYLVLWNIGAGILSGDHYPLPYLPIISPLDFAQLLTILLVAWWGRRVYPGKHSTDFELDPRVPLYGAGCMLFMWLNVVIARSVHHFAGVGYSPYGLLHSAVYHAAISISWSLIALFITAWASKKEIREAWFAGAALLVFVVGKLFLFDLASSGTIARIVSFLVVGGLMLLIGYLSPLPVSSREE